MGRLLLAAALVVAVPASARADGADSPILIREMALYGCALSPGGNFNFCSDAVLKFYQLPATAPSYYGPYAFTVIFPTEGCYAGAIVNPADFQICTPPAEPIPYAYFGIVPEQAVGLTGTGINYSSPPGDPGYHYLDDPRLIQDATITMRWQGTADTRYGLPAQYPAEFNNYWTGTYSTTPEPVSLALLGTGLVAVVAAHRRRRSQKPSDDAV